MLDALGQANRLQVEALLVERRYPEGALLVQEGEEGDGCYFIDQGTVRVERRAPTGEGGSVVVGYVCAGGVVGEMAMNADAQRSASVYAHGDVTARWLPAERFATLQRTAPAAALALSQQLLRALALKVEQHNRHRLALTAMPLERPSSPMPPAAPTPAVQEAKRPSERDIVNALVSAGLDTFCLVADSVFASMDEYLMELAAAGKVNRWVMPSERSIPAVATGRWLATGRLSVLSMQNSGFSHAMDYLRTVMRVHRVPGLVLSSWRGHDPALDDSEPHILVGDATDTDNRNTLGSEHVFGHRTGRDLHTELQLAIADACAGHLSCLRIAPPGFVRSVPLQAVPSAAPPVVDPAWYAAIAARKGRPEHEVAAQPLLTRDEALAQIVAETAHLQPFYVVGNGYNPRAMQALRLTERTFENAGGMGSTLAIAWGAAKSDPSRVYVAIDGDQNAQMSEMDKVLCADYPDNLYWYILNNGTGESVGTSRSLPLPPWFYALARVVATRNDPPGSFVHPRINASGLKFDSPAAQALAKQMGNLPAQAHLARAILAQPCAAAEAPTAPAG